MVLIWFKSLLTGNADSPINNYNKYVVPEWPNRLHRIVHLSALIYHYINGLSCASGPHKNDWLAVCNEQHYHSTVANWLHSRHYDLVCRNITRNGRHRIEVICPKFPFSFPLKSSAKHKHYTVYLNFRSLCCCKNSASEQDSVMVWNETYWLMS
jgi:hypothetical protein